MAHFARVENGFVTDVIVIGNQDCGGEDFPASEPIGQAFIAELAKNDARLAGEWFQTSYNTYDGFYYPGGYADNVLDDDGNVIATNRVEGGFRRNFAQVGYIFDLSAGEFGEFLPAGDVQS